MARTRKPQNGSAEQTLVAEEKAFRRQQARLIERYEDEYVALRDGRVIAHGPDDEERARRLFEDLGDQPFYIARLEREPTIYELPSPELER